MTLDEVIETLKRFPEDFVFERGFHRPHSYRGDYADLAFAPAENVTAGYMLGVAIRAKGSIFEGYKGGSYTMHGYTDCWLAENGSCGEEITTHFFEANGQNAEIASLREQLTEAREIMKRVDGEMFEMGHRLPCMAALRAFLKGETDNG